MLNKGDNDNVDGYKIFNAGKVAREKSVSSRSCRSLSSISSRITTFLEEVFYRFIMFMSL